MKLFGTVGVAFFFPKRQGSCWVAEAASHLYSLVLSALVPVCPTGRVFFCQGLMVPVSYWAEYRV